MAYNDTKSNYNGIIRDEANLTTWYAEDWNDMITKLDTISTDSKPNSVVTVAQDGTGDYNGTTSAIIQTAINSISATGGIIFIKKGTYTFSSNITLLSIIISARNCPTTCPLKLTKICLSDSYGILFSLSTTSTALWYTLSLYPGPNS